MKTLKELTRILKRIARVVWVAWTGLDILLLAFLTICAIIFEKVLSLIIIFAIIMVISYYIGRFYDEIFE